MARFDPDVETPTEWLAKQGTDAPPLERAIRFLHMIDHPDAGWHYPGCAETYFIADYCNCTRRLVADLLRLLGHRVSDSLELDR